MNLTELSPDAEMAARILYKNRIDFFREQWCYAVLRASSGLAIRCNHVSPDLPALPNS